MKKQKTQNKGITLIALVITIIVMLILVAVTVSMAINGGLFNQAGKATAKTNEALKAEHELSNGRIKVNGVWYDSVDAYLNGIKSEEQDPPTSLTISGPSEVSIRSTIELKVNSDVGEIASDQVVWSSSNDQIATVSDLGVVSANSLEETKAATQITITAVLRDDQNVLAEFPLTVLPLKCPHMFAYVHDERYYYITTCPTCASDSVVTTVDDECINDEDFEGDWKYLCEKCGFIR